jgi:hypothetical protein
MNPSVLCAADDEMAELLPNVLMRLMRDAAVPAVRIPRRELPASNLVCQERQPASLRASPLSTL